MSPIFQQWLTVIGLSADVVGFGLIALEWYYAATLSDITTKRELRKFERKLQDLNNDFYYKGSRPQGREFEHGELAKRVHEINLMWPEIRKGFRLWFMLRRKFVFYGVGLVILGFGLQIIGAWPV